MKEQFYGKYFKCQTETRTIAFIAANHTGADEDTCSIQIISGDGAYNVTYPASEYSRKGNVIRIGKSFFSDKGISVDIDEAGLSVRGKLKFASSVPLKYDIMGPFVLVPFMECRHSIYSMHHTVNGTVYLNGEKYVFDGGDGYTEGDRGRSFPSVYAWTHTFFDGGSLFLSAADIPFGLFHFTGVIGAVYYNGKEYRIATYLGAKAIKTDDGEIIVKQGDLTLGAKLIEKTGFPLNAPVNGKMSRTIKESAICKAEYVLKRGNKEIFRFKTDKASFEYEF